MTSIQKNGLNNMALSNKMNINIESGSVGLLLNWTGEIIVLNYLKMQERV